MDHRIKTYANQEEWLQEANRIVMESFAEAKNGGRRFIMGLSGGKTPINLYEKLSREKELLKGSYFFLVDERNVPWTDPKSNHQLIVDSLFVDHEIVNFLWDFRTDLEQAACLKDYSDTINRLAGSGLDLAVIGIGADGHFASIFPGFADWSNEKIAMATTTEINEVKERYSLSPNYLMKSKKILVMLAGENKSAILEQLQDEKLTQENFPAKLLLQHPALTIIISPQNMQTVAN